MGARLSYPEVDQSGRVAVVTGGNTGIGYETAKGLAVLGAHVVIACRSEERAKSAITRMTEEVSREHPDKSISVEFMPLDLASLQSVKRFTEDYKQKGIPLHLLINNAGIANVHEGRTEDDFELHFQVNHLGHFLLTLELLPLILSSAPDARVVIVSSAGHRIAPPFDSTNLQSERGYDRLKQYCSSKLYNILMGAALQRRVHSKGVTVSALHPGIVASEITRNFPDYRKMKLIIFAAKVFGQERDCQQGAATSLHAAIHPELNKEEFQYYADCRPAQLTRDARNEQFQEQLWEVSCNLLKDYLSPDIWREYGPKETEQQGGEATANETGEEPQEPPKDTDEERDTSLPPEVPDEPLLSTQSDFHEQGLSENMQQSEQDLSKGISDPRPETVDAVSPEFGTVDNY